MAIDEKKHLKFASASVTPMSMQKNKVHSKIWKIQIRTNTAVAPG